LETRPERLRTAGICVLLLLSVSGQSENQLVFERILTSYITLEDVLLKCSKFEWWY